MNCSICNHAIAGFSAAHTPNQRESTGYFKPLACATSNHYFHVTCIANRVKSNQGTCPVDQHALSESEKMQLSMR